MDTNAALANTAERVLKGEVSPGVAAGRKQALYTALSDRRAQRQFFDAFSAFRSQVQDAAVLSTACAPLMQRFLSIVSEHVPTQKDFDEALHRGRQ